MMGRNKGSGDGGDGAKAPKHRLRRVRRPRLQKKVSLNWLIPNILTVCALGVGLTGLRYALEGRWEAMVAMVALAAVFDALDGRVARMLNSTSQFGAQLDSLSDLVVFGVTPAVSLYLWALNDTPLGNWGWGAALFFTICAALRLARFNSELPDKPHYAKNYFTGVPIPMAAYLVLLPVVVDARFDVAWVREGSFVTAWMVAMGVLAISTLPTWSGKQVHISTRSVLPVLAVIGLAGAALIAQPWLVYIALCTGYLCTIPISGMTYARLKREAKRLLDQGVEPAAAPTVANGNGPDKPE